MKNDTLRKKISTVTKEHAGERLDRFVTDRIGNVSRGTVIRAIREGKITVNDQPTKPSRTLREGDRISLPLSLSVEEITAPDASVNCTIPILCATEKFVVIDKPPGIQVHPSATEKGRTVTTVLLGQFPELKNVGPDSSRPGIVHRLDKDTSGVMIVARTQDAYEKLVNAFKKRKMHKEYLALVHGNLKHRTGIINLPIARAPRYTKLKVAHRKFRGRAKDALTRYAVMERFSGYDLVRAEPRTGRMHQIRVHLSSIGHPIVGDHTYYTKVHKRLQHIGAKRFLLHAHTLSFSLDGEDYSFTAPLPPDFRSILEKIKKATPL